MSTSEFNDSLLQKGQDVNSEPWADQFDQVEQVAGDVQNEQADELEPSGITEHRIPRVESDDELESPQPLRQLISAGGVKLVAVPDGTWHFDGYSAKFRRGLSVTFSVDTVISGEA